MNTTANRCLEITIRVVYNPDELPMTLELVIDEELVMRGPLPSSRSAARDALCTRLDHAITRLRDHLVLSNNPGARRP
jgi:hypothetical protein